MAGRPREFDQNEALKGIQAAFWAHGYEGTSMADLVNTTGLASARLYAAFGSKESMFRAAIELYEREEGGFVDRALAEEPTARQAVERIFREAVAIYTIPQPRGCMVVSAAAAYSLANEQVRDWLKEHRRARTAAIVERLKLASLEGELPSTMDASALGDTLATLLHGLSVQSRDGVPRRRLLAQIPLALKLLDQPS